MNVQSVLLRNRWIRASAVAVLLCCWPACVQQDEEDPVPSAGSPSLDYVLKDMDGKDVNLTSLKGRPVLINFWATWCPPCKAEIPWFVEFAEKYRDRNLVVVGISVDDTPEDIRTFSQEYKVNYPMLVGLGHECADRIGRRQMAGRHEGRDPGIDDWGLLGHDGSAPIFRVGSFLMRPVIWRQRFRRRLQ